MNKVLALDQASRTSGWAVFEDKKLVDSGTFTVTDKDIGARLLKIKLKVADLIDSFEINEVILEDIQLQTGNVKTFKVLAEVYGVIVTLCEELQIPYSSVLAVQWKSYLKIKGTRREEQKKNAQLYVKDTYGLNVSSDESDAICIGSYKINKKPDLYFGQQ